MRILVVIPTQAEVDFFLQGCAEHGLQSEAAVVGRLPVMRFPTLGVTVGQGGLGKTQFAVQTQHLIDACSDWDLVICAGVAGALAEGLSVGDVVVATETIEHDIHNRFGKPLIPRFDSADAIIGACKSVLQTGESFRGHFGPIASGDEDVVDNVRGKEIQQRTGALAVAWEGAGGARACQFSDVPYVEVRGVTDNADGTAASDFEKNLECAMRNVAALVISSVEHLSLTPQNAGGAQAAPQLPLRSTL